MFPSLPRNVGPLLSRTVICTLLLLLTACKSGGYTYTFNNNVLFSPGPAGQKLANLLRDSGLQGCLNQLMEAGKLTELAQVQLLACPGSGVSSLSGIEQLSGLEQLELSDNKIEDLRPLASLKKLRVAGLRNNPVTTIAPLIDMQMLRFVSLQGDDQLSCKEVAALKERIGNTLSEPLHCVQ